MTINDYYKEIKELDKIVTQKKEIIYKSILFDRELLIYGMKRILENTEDEKYMMAYHHDKNNIYSQYLITNIDSKHIDCENVRFEGFQPDFQKIKAVILLYRFYDQTKELPRWITYDFVIKENGLQALEESLSSKEAIIINTNYNKTMYNFNRYDYLKDFIRYLVEYQFTYHQITSISDMNHCVEDYSKRYIVKPKIKEKIKPVNLVSD